MDDPMQNIRPDDEIIERLAAYSEAHLAPDPAAVVRMRRHVMAQARVRLRPADPSRAREAIPFRTQRTAGRGRRTVLALLAASLAVVLVVGASLAAEPGRPLYGVRLWVETVSLPSEPAARAAAELSRLDARMDEAVRAAGAGNESGVTAALAAYREILDDAVAAAGEEPAPVSDLEKGVDRHRAVLEGLIDNVPQGVQGPIQQVIDKQSETVDKAGGGSATPKPTKGPNVRPTPTPKPGRGGGGPAHTPSQGEQTAQPGGGDSGSGSPNSEGDSSH
jgi:hypothetical protein